MSNGKKGKIKRNEMYFTLREIRSKYNINISDIQFFAPVYYPIAILEMNLDEVSYEDFEAVQLAVLRFYSLGITEYQMIADIMGLSPNYVYKILHLLTGYGHIIDSGITEIGKQSLAQEKKIVKSQVWQRFQVDALNGTLLKVNESIYENALSGKDETPFIVGHLDYIDGISIHSIEKQMEGQNYQEYIKRDSDILSTNVISINDVKCTEVLYAKSFLMVLKDAREPLIFSKRYDSKKEKLNERFSWLPFSIESENIRKKYGFENYLSISTKTSSKYANGVLQLLKERATNINMEEEVQKALKKAYSFVQSEVTILQDTNPVEVYINEKSFTRFKKWILNFLLDLAEDGESIITSEYLFGNIISIRSNSSSLLRTAHLLNGKIKTMGNKGTILNKLNDKFKDFEPEENINIIDVIYQNLEGNIEDTNF